MSQSVLQRSTEILLYSLGNTCLRVDWIHVAKRFVSRG